MTKVLLVEDDNNLREIYEARLAAEGYDIVTAKDGEDALAVAKQHKPELIISDVMMPRISGFEMLDILRNTDGLKTVKVIMLTALGQSEDKTRADSLGADRYLVKSQVTLEDIVKAAEELLNPDAADENDSEETASSTTTEASPATPAVEPTVPAPEPVAQEPVTVSPVPDSEPELPTITSTAPTLQASPQPEVTLPTVETQPQPSQPPAPEAPAAPAPATEPQVAPQAPEQAPEQAPSPQPEPQAVQPTPDAAPAPTEPAVPAPEIQSAPASEPHTTIEPTASQVEASPQEQPAPEASAAPAPATEPQIAPQAPEQAPEQAPSPQPEPQAVQPTPDATPAPTEPAVPTTDENGISVVESPDLGVQSPYPGATEEAEPKIQMPHGETDSTPVVEAQTASQEEATVEKQIDQFVNAHQDTTTPAVPGAAEPFPTQQVEGSSSGADALPNNQDNEAIIEAALSNLNVPGEDQPSGAPQAPAEPAPAPQPEPQAVQPTPDAAPAPTEAVTQNDQQISGKKIIQPIGNQNQGPNINDLAAQEEIKENMEKGVTGAAVVSADPNPQPAQAPAPGVTPVPQTPTQPTTQQPGGVFTPNSNDDANMTAL